MNILVAADSFKDALPADQVCAALSRGISTANSKNVVRCLPLADGGEGTFEVLAAHLGLQKRWIKTCDPLHRPLDTFYGISADGKTAFIEMAKTAGLQLLQPEERNPLLTSTFGTGLHIADALQQGVQKIVLAIGGSATNDAGTGMAAALGWRFLDKKGTAFLPAGGTLGEISDFPPPPFRPKVEVTVICDVQNPLYGPAGAAHVYASQKGADDAGIQLLDNGLKHFGRLATAVSSEVDIHFPGTGAAGGMGFGAMLFLNATLRSGIDLILDLIHFEKHLQWADLVVTGEGKIDGQTVQGKLIAGLCKRAALYQKPVIAFCGLLAADATIIQKIGLQAAYSINDSGKNLQEMLQQTAVNLERAAFRVFSEKEIH